MKYLAEKQFISNIIRMSTKIGEADDNSFYHDEI